MAPLLRSNTSSISSRLRAALPLLPVRVAPRSSRPECAMADVTVAVSWPVSEPAPLPKPRLLLEVMPLLAVPTLAVISERSACESAPTAPVRFLV